jgi:solute carrier family 35, member F1/2
MKPAATYNDRALHAASIPGYPVPATGARRRYSGRQVGAAALAVAGLAALLLSDGRDAAAAGRTGISARLGDALVLLGSTGYAGSNVMTEDVLRRADPRELLAGLGGFGFLWSVLNVAVFEARTYGGVAWSAHVVAGMVAYTATLFCFYVGTMLLLQRRGSVVRACARM